jgi:hypothetical protein
VAEADAGDAIGRGPGARPARQRGRSWRHAVIRASAGGSSARAAFQQAKADHGFTGQELELKLDTQLTREIGRLATDLHNRYTR